MRKADPGESFRNEHSPEAIRARLAIARKPSLMRDSVLGATDGCVTTFAVVAGALGGNLSDSVVIILGFANLLADGFSMAAGNYLGAKSMDEELAKAKATEIRHIEAFPEGEKEEVRQLFAAKGFQGEVLEKIVTVISGKRELWVDTMVTEELGLRSGDAKPVRAAIAVFAAFCLAGFIPLLPFLIPGLPPTTDLKLSCTATAMTFFLIGFLKGRVLDRPAWKLGAITLLLGGAAAAIAYLAGWVLRGIASGNFY